MDRSKENSIDNYQPIFSDAASFEEAFRIYYVPLYRVVYPILKNKDQSEDVVQDLFVRLWQKRDTIHVTGPLKAYLYRAAVNASFDHLDKHRREVRYDHKEVWAEALSHNETESRMGETEVRMQISEALDKLPPACRTVFMLSREEEMSYKEIAESLQISVKTVENQMGKALKILREALGPLVKEFIKMLVIWFTSF